MNGKYTSDATCYLREFYLLFTLIIYYECFVFHFAQTSQIHLRIYITILVFWQQWNTSKYIYIYDTYTSIYYTHINTNIHTWIGKKKKKTFDKLHNFLLSKVNCNNFPCIILECIVNIPINIPIREKKHRENSKYISITK